MNKIRPWLWIGKYRDTLDLDGLTQHGIRAMLQLAEAVSYPGLPALYLPIEDGVPLASQHLRQGVEFVLTQKKLAHPVLIACGAAISRSTTFAVAALHEAEGLDLLAALRVVKDHHLDALPHPALWESLNSHHQQAVSFRDVLRVIRGGE